MNIFHILHKFIWWQKVADMKNAKKYFYLISEFSKFLQNSISIHFFMVEVNHDCHSPFTVALSTESAVKWPH